jgi:hypothetical protein
MVHRRPPRSSPSVAVHGGRTPSPNDRRRCQPARGCPEVVITASRHHCAEKSCEHHRVRLIPSPSIAHCNKGRALPGGGGRRGRNNGTARVGEVPPPTNFSPPAKLSFSSLPVGEAVVIALSQGCGDGTSLRPHSLLLRHIQNPTNSRPPYFLKPPKKISPSLYFHPNRNPARRRAIPTNPIPSNSTMPPPTGSGTATTPSAC